MRQILDRQQVHTQGEDGGADVNDAKILRAGRPALQLVQRLHHVSVLRVGALRHKAPILILVRAVLIQLDKQLLDLQVGDGIHGRKHSRLLPFVQRRLHPAVAQVAHKGVDVFAAQGQSLLTVPAERCGLRFIGGGVPLLLPVLPCANHLGKDTVFLGDGLQIDEEREQVGQLPHGFGQKIVEIPLGFD